MKKIILTAFLAVLVVCGVAFSEFFPDVIVTGTDGSWMDTRAYIDIDSAMAAVAALAGAPRDVYIVRQELATAPLTVPAGARLHFLGTGQIQYAGVLTINTPDIISGDRWIFNGIGDIDFPDGTVVRSAWFGDIVHAIESVEDNTVTLVISEDDTINSNVTVGPDVTLKWESAGNIITAVTPYVVSDVKNVDAGCYQIFAGNGDWDFLDGTQLKLDWFNRLRSAVTWVETEKVNLRVSNYNAVTFDNVIPTNMSLEILYGGDLAVDPGRTLTIDGPLNAGPYNIFSGAGSELVGTRTYRGPYPEWWGAEADGDGNTDDEDEFNDMISGLTDGATAKLSQGGYYFGSSGISLYSTNFISMEGPATIYYGGTGNAIAIQAGTNSTRTKHHFSDLVIIKTGVTLEGTGIYIEDSTRLKFDDVTVKYFNKNWAMRNIVDYSETNLFENSKARNGNFGFHISTSKTARTSFATNTWRQFLISNGGAPSGSTGFYLGQYCNIYRSIFDMTVFLGSDYGCGYFFDGAMQGVNGKMNVEHGTPTAGATAFVIGSNLTNAVFDINSNLSGITIPFTFQPGSPAVEGLCYYDQNGKHFVVKNATEATYINLTDEDTTTEYLRAKVLATGAIRFTSSTSPFQFRSRVDSTRSMPVELTPILDIVTATAGVATPGVNGVGLLVLDNASGVTITDFVGGSGGQFLVVLFKNNNTGITHGVGNIYLEEGEDYKFPTVSGTSDSMVFARESAVWREISRPSYR